ncbi:MAG: hypothetical protein ABJE95_07790 [Byssovorax sp.]
MKPDAHDVVDWAVRNAYGVSHEHVERGREAAASYGTSPGPSSPMKEDLKDTTNTVVRLWSDMFVLWLDLLGPLAPRGLRTVVNDFTRREDADVDPGQYPGHDRAPQAHQEWMRVTFRVSSPKPVEVTLDLAPTADIDSLVVQDLVAFNASGLPPITGASLARDDEGRVVVNVIVRPDQLEGIYLGTIADKRGDVRGALRLVVKR